MKCPPDAALLMADRQGVKIDYNPQCRGVWLDRGELDELVERAAPAVPAASVGRPSRPDFAESDYRGASGPHGQRRRYWLSDIFD